MTRKLPDTISAILKDPQNVPTHRDDIVAELYQARDAIFTVDPEDTAALEALAERQGDAAEMLGLPRNHLFDDGIKKRPIR